MYEELYFWIFVFYLIGIPLLYLGIKEKIKKMWIAGLVLIIAATRVLMTIRLLTS